MVTIDGEQHVLLTQWMPAQAKESSTLWEARAVSHAVKSLGPLLKGRAVQWNTDNQALTTIFTKGSMKQHLHEVAKGVWRECQERGIK